MQYAFLDHRSDWKDVLTRGMNCGGSDADVNKW